MCDECGWDELLEEIKEMCAAGGFEFADQTLSGIYDTVTKNEHCTERQKSAIHNIRRSKRPRKRYG